MGLAGALGLQAAAQLLELPLRPLPRLLGLLAPAALLRELRLQCGLGPLCELQAHPGRLRPPRLLHEPVREGADSVSGAFGGDLRGMGRDAVVPRRLRPPLPRVPEGLEAVHGNSSRPLHPFTFGFSVKIAALDLPADGPRGYPQSPRRLLRRDPPGLRGDLGRDLPEIFASSPRGSLAGCRASSSASSALPRSSLGGSGAGRGVGSVGGGASWPPREEAARPGRRATGSSSRPCPRSSCLRSRRPRASPGRDRGRAAVSSRRPLACSNGPLPPGSQHTLPTPPAHLAAPRRAQKAVMLLRVG